MNDENKKPKWYNGTEQCIETNIHQMKIGLINSLQTSNRIIAHIQTLLEVEKRKWEEKNKKQKKENGKKKTRVMKITLIFLHKTTIFLIGQNPFNANLGPELRFSNICTKNSSNMG